jgi:hypothetical protein
MISRQYIYTYLEQTATVSLCRSETSAGNEECMIDTKLSFYRKLLDRSWLDYQDHIACFICNYS